MQGWNVKHSMVFNVKPSNGLCVQLLPLICMLIHPPEPQQAKNNAAPLDQNFPNNSFVLESLNANVWTPQPDCAGKYVPSQSKSWGELSITEYYDPGFAKQYVAGLVGPEQCRLPSAQKCEWFTRDGPQLFVAITLICTAVATKPTPSHSFYHPPFFCVTLLFAPLLWPVTRVLSVLRSPFEAISQARYWNICTFHLLCVADMWQL